MSKKQVGKTDIKSINGSRLNEAIKLPIYYDGCFFVYCPFEIIAILREEHKGSRWEGKSKMDKREVIIIKGNSPSDVELLLYQYFTELFDNNIIEEKAILYTVQFNSNKVYFNHENRIPFAATPALSFKWNIAFLVTFPDGRKKIFSHPYKGYGSIVSNKFSYDISEYKKPWMLWSEEREKFFNETELAMESMIEKIHSFFNTDATLLAENIDNKVKLIG